MAKLSKNAIEHGLSGHYKIEYCALLNCVSAINKELSDIQIGMNMHPEYSYSYEGFYTGLLEDKAYYEKRIVFFEHLVIHKMCQDIEHGFYLPDDPFYNEYSQYLPEFRKGKI